MPSPGRNSGGIGRVSAKLVSWLTTIRPLPTRTLWEWVPWGMRDGREFLGIPGVADVDHRGAVRAAHMRDIGDVVLDHDLPAAGAIEIADLANTGAGPHDVLRCCRASAEAGMRRVKPGGTRFAGADFSACSGQAKSSWPGLRGQITAGRRTVWTSTRPISPSLRSRGRRLASRTSSMRLRSGKVCKSVGREDHVPGRFPLSSAAAGRRAGNEGNRMLGEKHCFDARHHLAAGDSLFSLRGPLAGTPAAGRRDRRRARPRRHQRAPQRMEQPLLQRPAGSQLGQLRQGAPVFLRSRGALHSRRRLPALSQSMAADSLAALDDGAVPRRMAQGQQSLSHAAARRRRRQSRPAHRRRSQAVRRQHALDRHRDAVLDRHAGLRSSSSCGTCRRMRR